MSFIHAIFKWNIFTPRLYPNNLKNWSLPQNSRPHSRLVPRQGSLAPDENSEEPSCQIPNFSSCLGIRDPFGIQAKTPNLTKKISFNQFKSKMIPFDAWKIDIKTHFPDSTDESLRKIYEAHSVNLYRLYEACRTITLKGRIH